jgi:hypothetical protein
VVVVAEAVEVASTEEAEEVVEEDLLATLLEEEEEESMNSTFLKSTSSTKSFETPSSRSPTGMSSAVLNLCGRKDLADDQTNRASLHPQRFHLSTRRGYQVPPHR